MGRTAFYATRFGISDYTIVDLPLSLIGQAVFLALTLGESSVEFGQEQRRLGCISLVTPAQFERSDRRWGVVMNVDSMPEMDERYASAYIERMKRDKAVFLSINHEANRHTVDQLAPRSCKISRSVYLLRPGYLEELYDFGSA